MEPCDVHLLRVSLGELVVEVVVAHWGSIIKAMKHDTHDKHGEFEMTQQDLTPEIGI